MDQSTKQLQEKKQKYVCITDAQVIWGEKCHEKFQVYMPVNFPDSAQKKIADRC